MSPTLINVIVIILIFGLTTYINIKTKFAKDEKEAMRHVKTLALNLALILACGWTTYRLFVDFSSPTPLDKKTLLFMLINSLSLFYVFISLHFYKILSLFNKQLSLFNAHIEIHEQLPCIKNNKSAQQENRGDKE
jgi:hypothetical protein